MILEKAVKKASQILKNNNIYSHELDAQLILSDIMKIKRETLIVNSEAIISERIIKKYDIAIKRRINREPVAYITGKKEFWSEDFIVNHTTLVPRPETELLIYKVINFFKSFDEIYGGFDTIKSYLPVLNFSISKTLNLDR